MYVKSLSSLNDLMSIHLGLSQRFFFFYISQITRHLISHLIMILIPNAFNLLVKILVPGFKISLFIFLPEFKRYDNVFIVFQKTFRLHFTKRLLCIFIIY